MGSNGRHRWFPFRNRSSSSSSSSSETQNPPREFFCPISGSMMSDPVVVSSGQTFERLSVQVCLGLGFAPEIEDGSKPDFSTLIPNLSMRTTIMNWCDGCHIDHPRPPDYYALERIVRSKMPSDINDSEAELLKAVADRPPDPMGHHADTEVMEGKRRSSPDSTVDSDADLPFTPLPFATRPACFSSQSSSSSSFEMLGKNEIETENSFSSSQPSSPEEESIYSKLRGPDIFDQEQGLILLKKMTRANDSERVRVLLCTSRILSVLRSLIVSKYSLAQNNALASLVNLSLEKKNKVVILRSGIVPLVIEILKSGTMEAQELAAGAIFSLSIDDECKTPIGVLGALPPLLHALRTAESDRARRDAALALYHLTLNQTNRSKLIRLGAVPALLSIIRSGEPSVASRVLLVLCNLASSGEGRAAMLDGEAVAILVGKLQGDGGDPMSEGARENCVVALYGLSHGNMRFKGLAREAGLVEALKEVEERGTERAREKARKILQMMKEKNPAEDEDGSGGGRNPTFSSILDSSVLTRTRLQPGKNGIYSPNSSNF